MKSWNRSRGVLCLVGLVGLLLFVTSLVEAADSHPSTLTLNQALKEAAAHSPAIRASRAAVEQAEARLIIAGNYPNDPQLSYESARRRGGGETETDREIRLAQRVEIGGQRSRRRQQAAAELDAARSRLLRQERVLVANVAALFIEALRFRDLVEIEQANSSLIRSLAEVERKRFDAGSVAQMQVNLARVQQGRAERDLRLTRGAYEVACTLLAEAIGLDPLQPPLPAGTLEIPRRDTPPISELVQGAMQNRADLEAFQLATIAARARIELASRQSIPDLNLEAFHGREDGSDKISGASIGVRIPLFNRKRGAVAEAQAAERRAVANEQTSELRVKQQIAAARAQFEATAEATAELSDQVLGTLEENLHLLQRSFESGKTGWTEVLVYRREFVDIQRDYLETLSDAWLAAIELDLAAGVTPAFQFKESRP